MKPSLSLRAKPRFLVLLVIIVGWLATGPQCPAPVTVEPAAESAKPKSKPKPRPKPKSEPKATTKKATQSTASLSTEEREVIGTYAMLTREEGTCAGELIIRASGGKLVCTGRLAMQGYVPESMNIKASGSEYNNRALIDGFVLNGASAVTRSGTFYDLTFKGDFSWYYHPSPGSPKTKTPIFHSTTAIATYNPINGTILMGPELGESQAVGFYIFPAAQPLFQKQ